MTDLRKKIVAVATVFTFLLGMAGPAMAATAAELQASIDALMAELTDLRAELAELTGEVVTECCSFTRNLYPEMSGADVKCLQEYLNDAGYTLAATGAGSPGNETTYFGPLTRAAVKAWQDANSVAYGVWWGYFGPLSQAKYDDVCVEEPEVVCSDYTTEADCEDADCYWYDDACNTEEEEEEEEAVLEGGAGSITVDDSSTYTAEEVGEGKEDIEILEFEITPEGSDIEVISVKVEFVQDTAADSKDLDDYAESVSIWFGGDKVGEMDADRFSESNDVWTRSISLDDGVIIREDESEMLVVAITALSNLDSGDIDTDDWNVDVINVRFRDAQGVVTTEDTDGDGLEQTFDFASFAEAADLELKISSGDEAINDEHVIDVDDTNSTDNVKLLSFYIEAEGNSDILIKDLPVILTTTEAADTDFDEPGDIITSLYLYADGDKIGTESVSGATSAPADSQTVTFDDIDYTVGAGDKLEFIVKAKIIETDGVLDDGDTISADITSTERDAIDAEDESGEDLATTDMSGTATGGAHAMYDKGLQVEFTGSSYVKTSSDTANINETVEFTLTFKATAFGDDIWVDQTSVVATTGTDVDAIEVSLDNDADGSSTTCTDFDSTGDEGTYGFEVLEGQTETFTVTILGDGGEAGTAGSSVTFKARINGIGYNVTTDAAGDTVYAFNMTDYKSSAVTVFDR